MSERILEQLERHCRRAWNLPDLHFRGMSVIPEGHSGLTYFIDADGAPDARYVLRLPPPKARHLGPADVVRQGRIMAALRGEGVPVPRVHACGTDPDVLDGTPFLLVEAVDGVRAEIAVADTDSDTLAKATVEVLRRMHAVPVERTGLAGEPPADLPAEIDRWSRLMSRAPAELDVFGARLAQRLRDTCPPEEPPTLVHGDFTYGNILYRGGAVAAVIDWEIASIGQPLIDLGSLCTVAKRVEFPRDPNPSGAVEARPEQLMEWYGADSAVTGWFVALSYFKYASIQAYNLGLHRSGKRPDPIYDLLPETIEGLQRAAFDLVR
ncbi:phosphotransferase family protein [Nocardioides humi]|uniref:Phosphotransferase family protein n=1 Tax=Nocardioides humi TaxID=449461 RepID=A0ABN2B294_9ACTN|nr:phosphotransferase family protein [Nocardioides humi]